MKFAASALMLIIGAASTATAGPITLSIPNRGDYVFSNSGILYITAGSQIDRYDTVTNAFLSPYQVGGNLLGIDISPDGKTLAVADTTRTGIDLVSTSTGAVTQVNFTPAFGEAGAYTVAYGSNGNLLVSTQFNGSGSVPLREYDPSTNQTTIIEQQVRQATMLTASADRSTIGLAQANQTGGPIQAFSVATGTIAATTTVGSSFVYEIATNHNGTQFVVPTYAGANVYNLSGGIYSSVTTLGTPLDLPTNAVYSPNSHYLFTSVWNLIGGNLQMGVQVFDTNTWTEVASLDSYNFPWTGNSAYQDGWMRISANGDWLAVSIDGGTNLFNVSQFAAAVPEPNTFVLALTGFAAIGVICQIRRARAGKRAERQSPGDLS
jgi:hypothetical protein